MPRGSAFCEDDFNFGRASRNGFEPSDYDVPSDVDPRTRRPWGDHGTASQAVEYCLEAIDDPYDALDFLREWREGGLEDWPEFYDWLADQE